MSKTIAYITDIHLDEAWPVEYAVDARKNWQIILDDIATKKIDKIIFGGDIGEVTSNTYFFDSLQNTSIPFGIVLGNHDSFAEVIKHYDHPFNKGENELYYQYEDGDLQFVFMDSSKNEVSKAQLDWLALALNGTTRQAVIFIHHPVLKLDTWVDDTYPLLNRDAVKAVLLAAKKTIQLFCGHYHMEDERTEANIKQSITPAASYQLVKASREIKVANDHFAYRLIEIAGDKLSTGLVSFNS